MPERATLNQVTQVGVETTPGTGVAAGKLLQALSITPGIQTNVRRFRPVGGKFTTIAALGKEWIEARIEGQACYNHLAYLLSSVLAYAAPAQQGGTSAYLWTHKPAQMAEDAIKTFTVEQGSQLRAGKFTYGLMTEFSLQFDREEVSVAGTMLGQAYQDDIHLSTNATYTLTAGGSPPTAGTFTLTYAGQTTGNIAFNATPAAVEAALEALSTVGAGNVEVTATVATGAGTLAVAGNVYTIEFVQALAQAPRTLTGTFTDLTAPGTISLAAGVVGVTPTAVATMPIQPTQLDIYLDSTSGNIGATKLTRAMRGEFRIGDRFNPLWAINSAVSGFAAHMETAPTATLKLTLEADAAGMGPLAALRAGDKRYLRVKAVGPLIASTYYYTLQLDMCGVVAEVGEFSDEDGVYGIEWTFEAAYDSAWSSGTALQAQLTNILTAL